MMHGLAKKSHHQDFTKQIGNSFHWIITAQIVKQWFRKLETSFSNMDWPQQSPNLNPIKNL